MEEEPKTNMEALENLKTISEPMAILEQAVNEQGLRVYELEKGGGCNGELYSYTLDCVYQTDGVGVFAMMNQARVDPEDGRAYMEELEHKRSVKGSPWRCRDIKAVC